jgi:hypothetical protein
MRLFARLLCALCFVVVGIITCLGSRGHWLRAQSEVTAIGARGLKPQFTRQHLKNQNRLKLSTAMTSSESSRRDLSIEHNFVFPDLGPPCRGDTPPGRVLSVFGATGCSTLTFVSNRTLRLFTTPLLENTPSACCLLLHCSLYRPNTRVISVPVTRRALCIHSAHHSISFGPWQLAEFRCILQADARPSALLPNGGDWQLAHERRIIPKLLRDLIQRLTQSDRMISRSAASE